MAGEIPPGGDPEEIAGTLLAALLGIGVLARLRPEAARLESMLLPLVALIEFPLSNPEA